MLDDLGGELLARLCVGSTTRELLRGRRRRLAQRFVDGRQLLGALGLRPDERLLQLIDRALLSLSESDERVELLLLFLNERRQLTIVVDRRRHRPRCRSRSAIAVDPAFDRWRPGPKSLCVQVDAAQEHGQLRRLHLDVLAPLVDDGELESALPKRFR